MAKDGRKQIAAYASSVAAYAMPYSANGHSVARAEDGRIPAEYLCNLRYRDAVGYAMCSTET
eukprot:2873488-Rhodomonas_salina.1